MESTAAAGYSFYTTVVGAVLIAVVVKLFLGKFRGRKLNLPPGPKTWPIIGNLNLIGPLPHQSIHALSQKYGEIMQLRLGSIPTVVASSSEMAREFLATHDLNFVTRPKFSAGKYTTYNYSDMTWSPYGSYWRQARKIWVMELFSVKRLNSFEYMRVEEVRALIKNICTSPNKVNLKTRLMDVSLNVICRMVLGKKYLDGSEKEIVSPEEFKKMLDELFFLNGVLNIGDLIPWLHSLDLQGYVKRMKAVSRKFDKFLEHVLTKHDENRSGVENYVPKDLVDVLLQLSEDSNLEIELKRDGVKAFTQDLLAGGTESSAVTIEWAMSELLRQPEIISKAQEELDRVIGRERWVEERDIRNLPYIESIVKETMRMHPVAPMLVPRMSRKDCSINGYDIPEGTQVLVNVWTIGRDPKAWESPMDFRPERFDGMTVEVKGQDFQLLPFGAGRRMCPGYNLGLKVTESTLSNLLHGFDWKLPEGMKPEDLSMEEVFGLSTPRKVPLEAVANPRLPAHLYLNL